MVRPEAVAEVTADLGRLGGPFFFSISPFSCLLLSAVM